jgi:dTDP-4-dehydrorhamnose reductase
VKILLTGKDGQVGWELRRSLSVLGQVSALGREDLDLSNPDFVRRVVREIRPHLIVNAAAYTAVDRAESEEPLAYAINAIAPGILAEEARSLGAGLVHYSTDYVFDGEKASPYVEGDPPGPLNAYGRTKLAGEKAIAAVGGRYLTLRTSWVYGPRGQNFMRTIQRSAREREELRIVDDQTGAPTTTRVVADATAQLLGCIQRSRTDWPSGLYHLACRGETTWFGFARRILELAKDRLGGRTPRLTAIRTEQYPTPARRPVNSRLDVSLLERGFALELPDWEAALALCIEDLTV